MDLICITDYLPTHRSYFEDFKKHWIEKYFKKEALGVVILSRPEEATLKPGGTILMALYNERMAKKAFLETSNNFLLIIIYHP